MKKFLSTLTALAVNLYVFADLGFPGVGVGWVTDAELADATNTLNSAIALKQDASTAVQNNNGTATNLTVLGTLNSTNLTGQIEATFADKNYNAVSNAVLNTTNGPNQLLKINEEGKIDAALIETIVVEFIGGEAVDVL